MVELKDVEDPGHLRLWARCIGEPHLKALVQKHGEQTPCYFCKALKGRTFPASTLSIFGLSRLRQHDPIEP